MVSRTACRRCNGKDSINNRKVDRAARGDLQPGDLILAPCWRWADGRIDEGSMTAAEHAGAMYMIMTMMRPGLFFQREGPGSEPGNSLLSPDEAPRSVLCAVS